MLLPYSMMDKGQLDFLGGILDQATFAVGASAAGNPIRAMGIGNEVRDLRHTLLVKKGGN